MLPYVVPSRGKWPDRRAVPDPDYTASMLMMAGNVLATLLRHKIQVRSIHCNRSQPMKSLPILNSNYWIALGAASIFGTNTGDFLSTYLKFGNASGLPYLAMVLGAIFLIERISPWKTAIFFWAAIIVIRTGATNIADITHEFGAYGLLFVPPIIGLFVFAVRQYKSRGVSGANDSAPRVDSLYWVCMALAGIVGTLVGDYASGATAFAWYGVSFLLGFDVGEFSFDWFWIGHVISSIIFGGIILRMFSRLKLSDMARPYAYWLMIALIRTAGTAVGDFLATTRLQLYGSTILTGICFLAIVVGFYVFKRGNVTVSSLARG
jgi:uncharacterized membrane-anchored protein